MSIIFAILLSFLPAPFGSELLRILGIVGTILGLIYAVANALGYQGQKDSDKEEKVSKKISEYTVTSPRTSSEVIEYLDNDSYFKESWTFVRDNYQNGNIPKNPGTILEDVLKYHCSREDTKKIMGKISFEDLKSAFSYNAFKMLERNLLNFNVDRVLFAIAIDRLVTNKFLSALKRFFYFLFFPIGFIFSLLFWVINAIIRVLLPEKLFSFFWKNIRQTQDFFNVSKKVDLKKATRVLDLSKKIGLVNIEDDDIEFTSRYWKEYFAANYLKEIGIDTKLKTLQYQERWQRINWDFDPAVINL